MEIFFNIFNEHGWVGIIGLLVCMLLFFVLKKMTSKITTNMTNGLEKIGENLAEQMSKQNSKLLNTIVDQQNQLVRYLISDKENSINKHNSMLMKRMELSEDINDLLKTMLYSYHAQRVCILEFHNSYENLNGVPFAKYSCTFEKYNKGTLSIINKCVGLPFSTISHIINDILHTENHQIVYHNLQDIEENQLIFDLLKKYNTVSLVYTAMYNNDNEMVGLVAIEYHKEVELSDDDLAKIRAQSAELTSLINIKYKYSSIHNIDDK